MSPHAASEAQLETKHFMNGVETRREKLMTQIYYQVRFFLKWVKVHVSESCMVYWALIKGGMGTVLLTSVTPTTQDRGFPEGNKTGVEVCDFYHTFYTGRDSILNTTSRVFKAVSVKQKQCQLGWDNKEDQLLSQHMSVPFTNPSWKRRRIQV